jgi:hypothetical protein
MLKALLASAEHALVVGQHVSSDCVEDGTSSGTSFFFLSLLYFGISWAFCVINFDQNRSHSYGLFGARFQHAERAVHPFRCIDVVAFALR